MTREEQIKEAAIGRYGNNGNESQYMLGKIQAFMVGARWADKTMIEKACAWLEQHQESYDMYDAWNGDYVNFKSLIIDFRKAMEE